MDVFEKGERINRWIRRKRKHRKDGDHIPGGFQGGNRRHHRKRPVEGPNATMGKARSSRS